VVAPLGNRTDWPTVGNELDRAPMEFPNWLTSLLLRNCPSGTLAGRLVDRQPTEVVLVEEVGEPEVVSAGGCVELPGQRV